MENIKILGFYKREKDGNEYIHYVAGKKEHLTNGIFDWTFHVNEKVKTLVKADIDLHSMSERLKKHKPYSPVIQMIDDLEKGE